ncbi:formimidoylglutamate deiminase [Thalassiella azotivora]
MTDHGGGRAYWCEHAWLPAQTPGATAGPVASVRVVVDGERIGFVSPGASPEPGDHRLAGLVLPGFANAHSHAFHRALRGRTHGDDPHAPGEHGSFWTWRRRMYEVAAVLDPDLYLALARATYAEMALSGVSAVGEFHYLHHGSGGQPYADPNVMGAALVEAAADAGIRLTLLDTCYLAGGLDAGGHRPLDDVQRRFADADADAWAERQAARSVQDPGHRHVRHGVAAHSVRAVPAEHLHVVRDAAAGRPLHVHLSEQPAENEACHARYGLTPTGLLAEHEVLGPRTTAVHATHLTRLDVQTLAATGTTVCACPTTEADLADGIGPFGALRDAGSPVCVGSDQHVATDLLREAQLVEGYERLATGRRGTFAPADLVGVLTRDGHRALGWDGGELRPGAHADLVAVRLDGPRTAGAALDQVPVVAAADDVHAVVVDGRVVVDDGRHTLGDVGALLRDAVRDVWAAVASRHSTTGKRDA